MPQFDPELIQVMKKVLEDIMTRVPLEHSTPAAKAYFAECILKAAAQGKTSYDALIVAAADQNDNCHNELRQDAVAHVACAPFRSLTSLSARVRPASGWLPAG